MVGLSRDELMDILAQYTKRIVNQNRNDYWFEALDEETRELARSNYLMIGLVMELIEANNRRIAEQLAAKGISFDD